MIVMRSQNTSNSQHKFAQEVFWLISKQTPKSTLLHLRCIHWWPLYLCIQGSWYRLKYIVCHIWIIKIRILMGIFLNHCIQECWYIVFINIRIRKKACLSSYRKTNRLYKNPKMSPVNSPHKDQWRGALIFCVCTWINNHCSCWFKTPSRPLWRHSNGNTAFEWLAPTAVTGPRHSSYQRD